VLYVVRVLSSVLSIGRVFSFPCYGSHSSDIFCVVVFVIVVYIILPISTTLDALDVVGRSVCAIVVDLSSLYNSTFSALLLLCVKPSMPIGHIFL